MIINYTNGHGTQIDLMTPPYRMVTTDVFESEWDLIENGDLIIGFERKQYEKEIEIDILAPEKEIPHNIDYLVDVFEQDTFDGSRGTLCVNNHSLKCTAKEIAINDWRNAVFAKVKLSLVTDEPFWLRKRERAFSPGTGGEHKEGLNYQYNYKYDYTAQESGSAVWDTGISVTSYFEMIIFGPCVNPRILVNEHPYEVYDTLEKGEYIILSNLNKNTIVKYRNNGTTANLFDLRAKSSRVFEMIPAGRLNLNWAGTFGFTLKLYERRSMPGVQ